ncbi:YdcF family protein [Nocardia sp. NPDC059240]|uniref:YdcF family protein n=1 Tax=Nocardia sp. NPDC059240 TaxID=3346786 RepID=UPI00368606D7
MSTTLPDELRSEVEVLWDYNQLNHDPRPVDIGIGLGSHDLGVATCTAELYHQSMFPLIVFTGANAPTTIERFPRGEAVHYREHALELGVPEGAILVEPNATNTSENIAFTRALLTDHQLLEAIGSVMLISRPYQQRRSYAIARRLWPEVEIVCASLPQPLDDYVRDIGDVNRVINMLVGDTQRIWVYPSHGWAIEQEVPGKVQQAYAELVHAGFTSRLLPE